MSPKRPTAADRLKAQAAAVSKGASEEKGAPPAETAARTSGSAEVRKSVPAETQASARPPAVSSSPRSSAASTRTRPVKLTVNMSPVEHRKLKLWCAQAAADLELPEVAVSEVMRVLAARLQSDEDLAARVLADLAANGGSRRG